MTTNKLLAGVAFAALLTGAAQAQVNTFLGAGGDLQTDRDFASEYDGIIGAEALFQHDADNLAFDALGTSAVVDIVFTFNNGLELAETAGADDFNLGVGGDVADCTFAANAGGGIGSNSVTYRHTSNGAGGTNFRDCAVDNSFDFDLLRPAASAGSDATATVQFICRSDCGGFIDTSQTFTLIDETSAFPPAGRVITAGGTVTLDSDGIGAAGPHILGNVSYQFDNAGGTIFTDTNGATPAGIAAVTAANAVQSATLVIDFPAGRTGVASVDFNDGAWENCPADAAPATTFTCSLDSTELAALAANGDVRFTSDDTNPVPVQTPTATLTVVSNATYSAPSGPNGNLNQIQWDDGLNTDVPTVGNNFEWVSVRSSGGTNNAFRVTGLPTNLSATGACIEVQAGDTNTTIANAGWNCVNATVVASANGTWTATFGSAELNAALGAGEGNADVQFRVRRADTINAVAQGDGNFNAQIVIRRLLARNGIVTGTGFDGADNDG